MLHSINHILLNIHIDEKNQNHKIHIQALNELKRVAKKNGYIIIIDGNRYNPLFYPHMVKMLNHNHWRQSYFKKIIKQVFITSQFKFFEAHNYPGWLKFWKIYEWLMENLIPEKFLAYNVAIIKNE